VLYILTPFLFNSKERWAFHFTEYSKIVKTIKMKEPMKKTTLIVFTLMVTLFVGSSGVVYAQDETNPEAPAAI